MLALGFLNPLLLWALPLAAVPIIIHLLNRRRFKKVPWAAMEYLLAAMKRNRRRLRMEQWILLGLRTLAVLLLVFLVARPQLAGGGLIAARTHHVVCLDDSASMAQMGGAVSVYDDAEERVRQLVVGLAEVGEGDLFTLIRASRPGTPLLSAVRVGADLPARVGDSLSGVRRSDLPMDLGRVLGEARRRGAETEETGETALYLITDHRERDWLTGEGSGRAEVVAEVMALHPEEEHLTVFPLGPRDRENLAVTDLTREGRLSVTGVPMDLRVTVTNTGLLESGPTEVAIEVDERSRLVRPVERGLKPGESVDIEFKHVFYEAGFHGIVASLPSDRYPLDDSRSLAVEVKDASRVLLVDGDQQDRPEDSETFFLALALDPGGDSDSGVEVRVVDRVGLDQDLDEFDMVWLCNVPVPESGVIERLERFAADGGGVVFLVGNQVDPQRYNEAFYRDGEGLLPLPLGEIGGDPDRPDAIFLADPTHPSVAAESDVFEIAFGSRMVLLGRYLSVQEVPGSGVAAILRVGDDRGPPLMVGRAFQSGGEVLLIATTADRHWSNLPVTLAYVPLVNEIHKFAAKVQDLSAMNLASGEVYSLELDLGRYQPDVLVQGLAADSEARTFTAISPTPGAGRAPADPGPASGAAPAAEIGRVDVPLRELQGVGLYEVTTTTHGGSGAQRLFARNAPVEEGHLQKLTPAAFAAGFPAAALERITVVDSEGGDAALLAGQGELWRLLGIAMLASLLLESLLAWRFGRR